MKLSYLWINKYKHIEREGFNFNPKLECDFDGKQFTYKTVQEPLENFFDQSGNVDIMAIIGENGSGKSTILESLLTDVKLTCSPFEEKTYAERRLWIEEHGSLLELNISDLSSYKNIILIHEDIDSNLYQNKYNANQYIKNVTSSAEQYQVNNIVIAFFAHVAELNFFQHLQFVPTHLALNTIDNIDTNDFVKLQGHTINFVNDWHDTHDSIQLNSNEINKLRSFFGKILQSICHSLDQFDIKKYLYIREFVYKLNHRDQRALKHIEDIIIKQEYNDIVGFIEGLDDFYQIDGENIFREIVGTVLNLWTNVNAKNLHIELKTNKIEKLLSNIHRGFFEINFYKKLTDGNRIYFTDLSSGEQKLLLIFAKIFYVFRKVFYTQNKLDFVIFLDEPDIHLHPQWQKNFISYLLDFLKNVDIFKNKKFDIFISSHSPFILSDFPKTHTLFLKNGKQIDSLNMKETFASNIHTLLADSFFMQDGLMGTFAKEKLTRLYEFLTDNHSKSEMTQIEAKTLIDLIGEPLIQKQFMELYEKRYQIKSKDQIIQELSQRIRELEERQND